MMYLVFAGDWYYPDGGWEDFVGSADTLEKARALLTKCDWYHIVYDGEIVEEDTNYSYKPASSSDASTIWYIVGDNT